MILLPQRQAPVFHAIECSLVFSWLVVVVLLVGFQVLVVMLVLMMVCDGYGTGYGGALGGGSGDRGAGGVGVEVVVVVVVAAVVVVSWRRKVFFWPWFLSMVLQLHFSGPLVKQNRGVQEAVGRYIIQSDTTGIAPLPQ